VEGANARPRRAGRERVEPPSGRGRGRAEVQFPGRTAAAAGSRTHPSPLARVLGGWPLIRAAARRPHRWARHGARQEKAKTPDATEKNTPRRRGDSGRGFPSRSRAPSPVPPTLSLPRTHLSEPLKHGAAGQAAPAAAAGGRRAAGGQGRRQAGAQQRRLRPGRRGPRGRRRRRPQRAPADGRAAADGEQHGGGWWSVCVRGGEECGRGDTRRAGPPSSSIRCSETESESERTDGRFCFLFLLRSLRHTAAKNMPMTLARTAVAGSATSRASPCRGGRRVAAAPAAGPRPVVVAAGRSIDARRRRRSAPPPPHAAPAEGAPSKVRFEGGDVRYRAACRAASRDG
jgi:hypothetical protein